MRIRLFGRLRDAVGASAFELVLPADVRDSAALRALAARDHPALLDSSVRMAIGDRILSGCEPLGDAEEVAFLPAVSGG